MRSNQTVTGIDESTAAALDERKHQDSSIRQHEGEVVRTGLAGLVDGFWARVDNMRIGQRLVMMVALVILPLGGVLIDSQRSLILAIGATLPGIVLAVVLLARIARQARWAESLATAVAQTQSSAIASIAAAVEQLFDSTDEMRINARVALRATDTSARATRESAATSRDAAQHLTAAARGVADAGGRIAELATQSEEISRIVRVIKEIADQTNLLALNAAIAATHAGEQGRGFAASADEVRKLAERTGNSTQEIAALIQRIQNVSRSVANEVTASSKEIGAGAKSAAQAGDMVATVESALVLASQAVQSISNSLIESSAATRDIAGNLEGVSLSTETDAQTVRESKAVGALADKLKMLAGQYRA